MTSRMVFIPLDHVRKFAENASLMRWSARNLHVRPRVPAEKLDAVLAFAKREGAECEVTRMDGDYATVETRGLNPSKQRRIDRWISGGVPLTEEPARSTHLGGQANTRFTI